MSLLVHVNWSWATRTSIDERLLRWLRSSDERVLSLLVVIVSLLLLGGHLLGLEGGQAAAGSTGALLAEVTGRAARVLELGAGSGNSLLRQHGQHSGNGLSGTLNQSVKRDNLNLRGSW